MNRKKSFNRPALWEHLLFLGPASIVFLIVIIIPFIISVGYSFTDWNGVSSNISFLPERVISSAHSSLHSLLQYVMLFA